MSKGSAIISILIAFVAGLAIGNLIGHSGGGGGDADALVEVTDEVRADDNAVGAAAPADDIVRLRAEVPENAPQRGPDDALVTIVMWSDYECPFCGRVEPALTRIINEHRNDVRIVWRDNPLPFHQNAGPAAQAAREAFAQGGNDKFWRYHGILFENRESMARADLERYAQQIGLNMQRFRAALDNTTHAAGITADQQAAAALGARGTPAFFINGRQLMGAQPYEQFETIVTEEIANAQRLIRAGTPRNQIYATLMRGARTSPAPTPQQPSKAPQPARRQPDPAAVYRVPLGDSPAKGPANALVTIVEFSEFQCPFCNRVQPTITQIQERWGDEVRFVFKHNPLPFHDNAMPAAEAALEVQAQLGDAAFFTYHDILFQNQQQLTRENLERWAQALPRMNMARFRTALDNHTHREAIQADQQLARSLGASGTPAFFINGRNLRGAQPFPAFERVITEELARARALLASGTPRSGLYAALIADGATEQQFLAGAGTPTPTPTPAPAADQVYDIAVPRNAPSRGPANAPVTIQLFSDFQCPFCGRIGPALDQIAERFPTQVRVIWRDYPLPFHDNAMPAAEAGREVFAQAGSAKFWQFHDLLFENQRDLGRESLERFAQQLGGIDMNRFRAALDNNTHRAAVQADVQAVQQAGARIGTPSCFINGRLLQGAQPFAAFETAINRALED